MTRAGRRRTSWTIRPLPKITIGIESPSPQATSRLRAPLALASATAATATTLSSPVARSAKRMVRIAASSVSRSPTSASLFSSPHRATPIQSRSSAPSRRRPPTWSSSAANRVSVTRKPTATTTPHRIAWRRVPGAKRRVAMAMTMALSPESSRFSQAISSRLSQKAVEKSSAMRASRKRFAPKTLRVYPLWARSRLMASWPGLYIVAGTPRLVA